MNFSEHTPLHEFVKYLYRGGKWGYWWVLSEKTEQYQDAEGNWKERNAEKYTDWFPVHKKHPLPRPESKHGPRHVYFGVHPTAAQPHERTNRKTGEVYTVNPRYCRILDSDVCAINCLYGDFDARDFGGKEPALQHIEGLHFTPSVIVDSGGGYHCYWLLKDTFHLEGNEDRQRARRLQAAWVILVNADRGVKDLARVLRVPGYVNPKSKYAPDYPMVDFVRCDLTTVYHLETLEQEASPYLSTGSTSNEVVQDAQAYQRDKARERLSYALGQVRSAGDGEKHPTLLKMAKLAGGYLHYGAYTESEAQQALYDAIESKAVNKKQAEKTIQDGLSYGKDTPLTIDVQEEEAGESEEQKDLLQSPVTPTNGAGWAICPHCKNTLVSSRYGGGWCPDCRYSDRRVSEHIIYHPDQARGNVQYVTDWAQCVINALALQQKQFDELVWVVDRILPEGACLLAGKPKSRKSWLALAISVAVASGGKVMGHLNVTPGRVLFLDLESNQRRMQSRLRSMLERGAWPDTLHVANEWPRGNEGLAQLDQWMATYPDTRLIVIDVMADFRRPKDAKEDPYIYDRATIKPINEWAERHRVTVLMIHHTRKAKADDVFDEISGSTGLPSAVATMWVIGRSMERADEYVFAMRGRDLEDDEPLALKWDTYLCAHTILGEASQYAVTAERREILDVMADGEEWTPKDIAAQLSKSAQSIKKLLPKLLADGAIEKVGYGKYAIIASHSVHSGYSGYSVHSAHSPLTQSECKSERVTGLIEGGHSCLGHQEAVNSKSDQSDHSLREVFVVEFEDDTYGVEVDGAVLPERYATKIKAQIAAQKKLQEANQ